MKADIDKLRALAEAATRGPWKYDGMDVVQLTDGGQGYPLDYYPDSADIVRGQCGTCGDMNVAITRRDDAVFIAAASPDVVVTLLDDNAQLRVACAKWQDHFTNTPGLAHANAEIVSLRAQLSAALTELASLKAKQAAFVEAASHG